MAKQITKECLLNLFYRLKDKYSQMIDRRINTLESRGLNALHNKAGHFYWEEEKKLYRRIERVKRKLKGIKLHRTEEERMSVL